MKIHPIQGPLPGEHVVAVHPRLHPHVDAGWRRRIQFHTGRSLSGPALTGEQEHRAGQLALLGQRLAPGVAQGLEVDLEMAEDGAFLHVGAGFGFAASGEDVVVPRALRVPLDDLLVYLTPRGTSPRPAEEGEDLPDAAIQPPPVAPPVLRGPFRELRTAGSSLAGVAILILEPVEIEEGGEFDPLDPCEQKVHDEAFSDRRRVDACRISLFDWPWPELIPDRGPTWRNELAYTVFRMEAARLPGEHHPWERRGVPIGLIGFDAEMVPLFVDANAVMRAGGDRRLDDPLLPQKGGAQLWKARVDQFAEHLNELLDADAGGELLAPFRYLPPVGLLPRSAIDPAGRTNRAFPSGYTVEAVPVPVEQLESALTPVRSCDPLDLRIADRVRILVPVPQAWFEPRLLVTEETDPAFGEAIQAFVSRRAEYLLRREDVRRKLGALLKAAVGKGPYYPPLTQDPDRLEEELSEEEVEQLESRLRQEQGDDLDNPEEPFGTILEDGARRSSELHQLRGALAALPLMGSDLTRLDEIGLESFITFLDAKTRRANDFIDFGFLRIQSDMYRLRKLMVGETASTRLATSPALAGIIKGESALTVNADLRKFLDDARISGVQGNPTTPTTTPASPAGVGSLYLSSGAIRYVSSAVHATGATATGSYASTIGATANSVQPHNVMVRQPAVSFQPAANLAFTQPISTPLTISSTIPTKRAASPAEIFLKSPIVGESFDFRTVTVGERLETPPANEAKSFAVASRFELLQGLDDLDLGLDDLLIPGFVKRTGGDVAGQIEYRVGSKAGNRIQIPIREPKRFGDIKDKLHAWVLEEDDLPDSDEAAFFSVGVELLDGTIAALRNVEGRVQRYRTAVAMSREALERIRSDVRDADRRLRVLEDELAEARHDVAVARALLAEEEQRVGEINERRQSILRDHVRFVAFARPRYVNARITAPVRQVDPAFVESPVPPCVAGGAEPPAELRAMVELLREAPVRWFVHVPDLLRALDRPELLIGTLKAAKLRAQVNPAEGGVLEIAPRAGQGMLGQSIQKVFAAQQQTVAREKKVLADLKVDTAAGQSWQVMMDQARRVLSLGDLILAPHGRTMVDRSATRELDNILRVATCLYSRFGEVRPSIRLEWAERLSQHDAAANLRNLFSLPKWDQIAYLDRREMQALVDWLFGRVDPRTGEAVALINELVRVCLLLASHAPVNQILAGTVVRQTPTRVGGMVELRIDVSRLRIGMNVLLHDQQQRPVQGVVEDLGGGVAIARVVQAAEANVTIAAGSRVQVGVALQSGGVGAKGATGRTAPPATVKPRR